MERLNNWFKEMSELESEETDAFMNERMGPLLRISLLLLDYNNPWKYFGLLFFICSITLIHCVLMLYSVFLLFDDFDNFVITLHIALLFTFCLSLVIHFNLIRRPFCESMRIATEGFYDYGEELDPEIPIIMKRTRKEMYAVLILPASITMAFGAVIISPYVDEYRGIRVSSTYSEFGVNLVTTIPTYYPFPTDQGVAFVIAELCQATVTLFAALVFGCCDLLYFVASNEVVIQLHKLKLSLRSIDSRAKKLFVKRYQRNPKSGDQEKLNECLDYCLGQNIAHHKAIMDYLEGYNYIAGLPIAGGFVVGTLVIALSMISLSEKSERFKFRNFSFFLTVIAESMNMFLLSFYGDKLGSLSEDVYNEIYFLDWTKYHRRFKTSMMIFQDGTRKPLVLKALGLVNCNMETFSAVMNTAYSYFNLLSASKALENKK